MKSCLLIVPRDFYWLERTVSEGLAASGYAVTVANDEYPVGMIGKILGKLQIPIIFPLTRSTIARRFLTNRRYDLSLIFKGRGISAPLVREVRRCVDVVIGYNFDTFRLNRSPLNWFAGVTRYCTFDYRDADRWSLPLVELFCPTATTRSNDSCYDLSVLMRIHSRRLPYIDKVMSALRPATFFVYLYESNVFTFLINAFCHPRLYFKYRHYIHFRPFPYAAYVQVMRSSSFTVDYVPSSQAGITIRCFEAVGAKTRIITNNIYMSRSPHFDQSDYIIFAEDGDPEELSAAYRAAHGAQCVSRPRTLTEFMEELMAT
jgi:hypothetical protein